MINFNNINEGDRVVLRLKSDPGLIFMEGEYAGLNRNGRPSFDNLTRLSYPVPSGYVISCSRTRLGSGVEVEVNDIQFIRRC
ncbi:MAG: hypothetical protein GF368_00815 [Candidatus Aenigmarchaeota archaeon]|nr:hypothetical protein [Candidatus Aenigmarchaeota archaeon]